jgi:hypothetical protein
MDSSKHFEQQVLETRILQKVNGAHREAFQEKFPGQLEHILRLITERLHLGLDKRDGVRVQDPNTWILSSDEICSLAAAMKQINDIRLSITATKETNGLSDHTGRQQENP